MAQKIAWVAPGVMVVSLSALTSRPYSDRTLTATCSRNAGSPVMGAYWLRPSMTARVTASRSACGPSKSGKPWERLIAPTSAASWDMVVKMVVPTLGNLLMSMTAFRQACRAGMRQGQAG